MHPLAKVPEAKAEPTQPPETTAPTPPPSSSTVLLQPDGNSPKKSAGNVPEATQGGPGWTAEQAKTATPSAPSAPSGPTQGQSSATTRVEDGVIASDPSKKAAVMPQVPAEKCEDSSCRSAGRIINPGDHFLINCQKIMRYGLFKSGIPYLLWLQVGSVK
jgi:hypothetical protein